MKYFLKTNPSLNKEQSIIIRRPFLFVLLYTCAIRARRVIETSEKGIDQGEFYLSQMEYKSFGLKEKNKSKLQRGISKLINLGYIKKVEGKTGSKKANVYKLINFEVFKPEYEIGTNKANDSTQMTVDGYIEDKKQVIGAVYGIQKKKNNISKNNHIYKPYNNNQGESEEINQSQFHKIAKSEISKENMLEAEQLYDEIITLWNSSGQAEFSLAVISITTKPIVKHFINRFKEVGGSNIRIGINNYFNCLNEHYRSDYVGNFRPHKFSFQDFLSSDGGLIKYINN